MLQSEVAATMGGLCIQKSRELAHYYKVQSELVGCHFMDAAGCEFNTVDYMHLTKKGHAQLAEKLADLIPALIN